MTQGVPAVLRAIAVMDLLTQDRTGLSLSEISRRLGLPKSTAHGLCETLQRADLIRMEGRDYHLGAKSLAWAKAFTAGSSPVAEFQRQIRLDPLLADHTISLSVLDHDHVTYLASHETGKPLGVSFTSGSRLPAVFTATGKAILAQMEEGARAALLAGPWPAPLTPASVRDRAALEAQLPEWRQRGYALDREEIREGMLCIGVVIPDAAGRAIGGLALSMTLQEAQRADFEQLATAMQRIARELGLLF